MNHSKILNSFQPELSIHLHNFSQQDYHLLRKTVSTVNTIFSSTCRQAQAINKSSRTLWHIQIRYFNSDKRYRRINQQLALLFCLLPTHKLEAEWYRTSTATGHNAEPTSVPQRWTDLCVEDWTRSNWWNVENS